MSNRKVRKLHAGLSTVSTVKEALRARSTSYASLHTALHATWRANASKVLSVPAATPRAVQQQLAGCSWVGAYVRVIAAKHAQHTGTEGILVWASQTLVHIVTLTDRLVSVLRAGSHVQVQLPGGVAVGGSNVIAMSDDMR